MAEYIRAANASDVEQMAAMASVRREEYANYQPVFWRPSANAETAHRPYLSRLVADDNVITIVSEEAGTTTGFLIATIVKAPPVYDPGGPGCLIDDFAVLPGRWATTGASLLRAGLEKVYERGAVQAVVVTAHLDQPKREALRACGLSIASEWWVATPDTPPGVSP